MLTHETSLADVEHGRSRLHPSVVFRLRAAAIANVEHFLRASETSIALALPDPADRVAARRWRGRILQQIRNRKGE